MLLYNWPGNVRELQNTIQYMAVVSIDDTIRLDSLPESIQTYHSLQEKDVSDTRKIFTQKDRSIKLSNGETSKIFAIKTNGDLNLERAIQEIEEKMIREALHIGKTQDEAARLLGISRGALQYKLKNNPGFSEKSK